MYQRDWEKMKDEARLTISEAKRRFAAACETGDFSEMWHADADLQEARPDPIPLPTMALALHLHEHGSELSSMAIEANRHLPPYPEDPDRDLHPEAYWEETSIPLQGGNHLAPTNDF